MKAHALCALLFTIILAAVRAEETSPTVRLFDQDEEAALLESAQGRLRYQVTELVKSSNFQSGPGDKRRIVTLSDAQQDYRDTVATGEYLLMVVSPAQKISTAGGDVIAAEVVIGLRGPSGRNTVFTIDASGVVVSHAKYSGEIYLELKKTVAEARR